MDKNGKWIRKFDKNGYKWIKIEKWIKNLIDIDKHE